MHRLAYPLRYLVLVMGGRRFPTVIPTFVFASVLALPYLCYSGANFFHSGGFLDKILTFTSCLTGFYIAGLVAAATYSHPDLDRVIKIGPIYLIEKDMDGTKIKEHFTRREFVCCLFGYLSFASFMISLGSSYLTSLAGTYWSTLVDTFGKSLQFTYLFPITRATLIICCAVVVSHLTTTTCIGLYYMMDRLHRRDKRVGPSKSDKAA